MEAGRHSMLTRKLCYCKDDRAMHRTLKMKDRPQQSIVQHGVLQLTAKLSDNQTKKLY